MTTLTQYIKKDDIHPVTAALFETYVRDISGPEAPSVHIKAALSNILHYKH
jgi:hypothetical protein